MKSRLLSCFYVLLLLGFAAGALWIADAAWNSITGYRVAYETTADLPPAGEPLAERVVLIVLDGIRVDIAEEMPRLQALRQRGAAGSLTTIQPSLSRPARATLATGAIPEVHGVMTNGSYPPPKIPSLFSLAHAQGLPTAVFGDTFWQRAFPGQIRDLGEFDKELYVSTTADSAPLVDWQNEVCDGMVPFLQRIETGLLVAGVTAPDAAGHDFGGESAIYRDVAMAADDCIGRLVEALDDDRTAFVVTSDHGHIHRRDQGGHGGTEPEVVRTPLVMAGAGIEETEGIEGSHLDVAPTIAVLLGLPLPAYSAGRPLTQGLALEPEAKRQLAERVDQQQEFLQSATPDFEAVAAREGRRRSATGAGLLMLCAALATHALFRLKAYAWRGAVGVLLFVAVYALFFNVFGLAYSLSAVVREEYLNDFFLRNMAAAALGFVAAAVWLRREILRLGLLVQALLLARVAWTYGNSGLFLETRLPDLDLAFRCYLDLLAVAAVALAAIVLAPALARFAAPRSQPGAEPTSP